MPETIGVGAGAATVAEERFKIVTLFVLLLLLPLLLLLVLGELLAERVPDEDRCWAGMD